MRISKGQERLISPIYGDLGRVRIAPQAKPNMPLLTNESGRITILGHGETGGKGEGLLFLDKHRVKLGYELPAINIIIDITALQRI